MEVDGDRITNNGDRIMDCEVCGKNEARYTCPRCEVRTCCLECVKIHKKELECDGLRDKVKFKELKHFNNIDLLNDYRLLEETARVVSKPVKLPPKSCYNERFGTLPQDLYRLKCTSLSRGVQLHFLPPSFSRHQANTSYLDHSTQSLYWRIEWKFPQAGNISITDERVLDSTMLSACLHKFIETDRDIYPELTFYQAAGHSGVKLLLKAEKIASNRYFLLDPTMTLRENLCGKSIIEYPVIFVVLNHHVSMFTLISEDDEENLRKRVRRHHFQRKNTPYFKNNFLFSTKPEHEEFPFVNNEGASDNEESSAGITNEQHSGTFSQQGNWRHFRRGRGHHNFRNGRNMRNHRGHRQRRFGRRNKHNFSETTINGQLSNHMNSVNIQS